MACRSIRFGRDRISDGVETVVAEIGQRGGGETPALRIEVLPFEHDTLAEIASPGGLSVVLPVSMSK
jgi:hypothetical protein